MSVGRSKAVERPSPPAARIAWKRSLVSIAVPKPGEHPHRPELRAVHRRVGPAGVRVLARVLAVLGPVDRIERHARHRLEVGLAEPRRPRTPACHRPVAVTPPMRSSVGHAAGVSLRRGGSETCTVSHRDDLDLHRPAGHLLEQPGALAGRVALELGVVVPGRAPPAPPPGRAAPPHRPSRMRLSWPRSRPIATRSTAAHARTSSWSSASSAAHSGWRGLRAALAVVAGDLGDQLDLVVGEARPAGPSSGSRSSCACGASSARSTGPTLASSAAASRYSRASAPRPCTSAVASNSWSARWATWAEWPGSSSQRRRRGARRRGGTRPEVVEDPAPRALRACRAARPPAARTR